MVKVKIPYFTSVVRNAHDLTNKPEAESTPILLLSQNQCSVFQVFKLLKATRQGNKSKEGFVVTHGNRTRGLSHRKPRTNQLGLDYPPSCSVSSVERNARDTKMTTRVYNSLTKVRKPETARSANCANLCSFVFPPPTHGAYHKRSELINFTRKSIFPGLILLKTGA